MTENERTSFRVEPDAEMETELFHEGRIVPCMLENLSAGGARLRTKLQMSPGTRCTVGIRLRGSLRSSASMDYLSFLMEVLESTPLPNEMHDVRLRSTTTPGAPEYEAIVKLVFEAHRHMLASQSGANEASPMASDSERRSTLASKQHPRFSKKSFRPDIHD